MKRPIALFIGFSSTLYAGSASIGTAQSTAKFADPLELFSRMMPVFGHPRCANCHGGVDPFAMNMTYFGSTAPQHGGGQVDRDENCTQGGCHDNSTVEGAWRLAPAHLKFSGKTVKELCELQSAESHVGHGNYLSHLSSDRLIGAAFDGDKGGAGSPEKPRMSRDDFVQAAALWLASGNAKCSGWSGLITQTETFASNYGFPAPGPNARTAVNQSAKREIKINREFGQTTATIDMSGHEEFATSMNDVGPVTPCVTTVTTFKDWSNAGTASSGPRPAAIRFDIADNGSYVIHFSAGGDENTRNDEHYTIADGCASGLNPGNPASIDLEWSRWDFNIRCPLPNEGPLALRNEPPDVVESLDCDLYDAVNWPRLKGKLTRVVTDHRAASDPQSWLATSPAGVSRADTGAQLPIRVVTEWDFVLVD